MTRTAALPLALLAAAAEDAPVDAATTCFRSGFRDNTWKVPLVASLRAEADGVPLPPPDPADPTKREFGWMAAHKYTPDRAVPYPFKDGSALRAKPRGAANRVPPAPTGHPRIARGGAERNPWNHAGEMDSSPIGATR